ncbi:hypothetical protein DUW94_25090 [Salmonella enterica]|nr:hypothetical protein [Salmonella enterica]EGB1997203.1 DotA/TraY family protein [Salmonella enterica]EII5390339.1 DotA/TraY family protein [Salmonella enterica]ELB5688848.1 DotA/TraY family protein [Salmonella enterica]EMC7636753.1 DotA/TraY family protein [Salmonella enterica]
MKILTKGEKRFNNVHWLLALLSIIFYTGNANAASFFELSKDDMAYKYFLDPIFYSGTSPLHKVIEFLNTTIMMVAGVFFIYFIISRIYHTAHDGVMLGKTASPASMLRYVIAIAFIFPAPPSVSENTAGYSSAQVGFLWVAKQGIAAAGQAWGLYTDVAINQGVYASPNMSRQIRTLAGNMLLNNICVAGINKTNNESENSRWGSNNSNFSAKSFKNVKSDGSGVIGYDYSSDNNGSYNWSRFGSCGSVRIQLTPMEPKMNSEMKSNASSMLDSGFSTKEVNYLHAGEINKLQSKMQSLANKIVEKGEVLNNEISSEIESAVSSYQNTIQNKGQEIFQKAVVKDYVAKMKEDGFITAGAYAMQVGQVINKVASSISNVPASSTVATGRYSPLEYHTKVKSLMSSVRDYLNNEMTATKEGIVQNGENADNTLAGSVMSWFIQDETNLFSSVADGTGNLIGQDPLIANKILGDKLITWAWVSYTAGISFATAGGALTGNIVGSTLGAGEAFGQFMSFISPAFFMLFSLLMSAGIILAVILPSLPFIIWIGAVIYYFKELILAFYAAPVFALFHMTASGDDFFVSQRTDKGYMELLVLAFRPLLMICGLISALLLLRPIGTFINTIFVPMFGLGVMSDVSAFGITQMFCGILLYSFLSYITTKRILMLIVEIPDKIFANWIGHAGSGGMTQEARESDATPAAAGAGVMGALSSGHGSGLSRMAGSMTDKGRDPNGGGNSNSVTITHTDNDGNSTTTRLR